MSLRPHVVSNGVYNVSGGVYPASAGDGATTVESFEDQDLSDYTGDKTRFEITNTRATDGSYALHYAGSTKTQIVTDSLSGRPTRGDSFSYDWYPASSSDYDIVQFLREDSDNLYYILMRTDTDSIRLRKVSGGTDTVLDDASYGAQSGQWYTFRVETKSTGEISVDVVDRSTGDLLAFLSADDSDNSGSAFTWEANGVASDAETFYDNLQNGIETNGTGIIDDFEDGDIGEYSGDTDRFTAAQTSNAYRGDYALEFQTTVSGGGDYASMTSQSGLPAYPRKGDEFEYWMYYVDTAIDYLGFYHEYTDSNNTYWTRINENQDRIALGQNVSGNSSSTTSSVTVNTGQWYRVNIKWDDGSTFGGSDGDQTMTLYDESGTQLAQASHTESTLDSGSCGWFGQATDDVVTAYADYVNKV